MAQNRFNIGNVFAERLQYDSAMVYYKAVEEEVKKLGFTSGIQFSVNDAGVNKHGTRKL
jgi:hypothetical protein